MNYVPMTPAEYEPYELPDPQFFLDLLLRIHLVSDLAALGFCVAGVFPTKSTLSEILKIAVEQEQEQEQEQQNKNKNPKRNSRPRRTAGKNLFVMCNNLTETITEHYVWRMLTLSRAKYTFAKVKSRSPNARRRRITRHFIVQT